MAFSDESEFNIDDAESSEGLSLWLQDTKEQIAELQTSKMKQTDEKARVWESVQKELGLTAKEPVENCTDRTVVVQNGPLLTSTWGQRNGYNAQLDFISCNGGTNNFQVFGGCVPIAMAQIMRYHERPTNYAWAAMPLNGASATTAVFISDIHDAIDDTYPGQPMYSCTATGVLANKDMGTVLKNEFGYSSTTFSTYNINAVRYNILANRPVILQGDNGTTGHMWVADGVQTVTYYYADCTGSTLQPVFHMNWGWYGASNGWFTATVWNPSGTNFNSNKKMLTIVP